MRVASVLFHRQPSRLPARRVPQLLQCVPDFRRDHVRTDLSFPRAIGPSGAMRIILADDHPLVLGGLRALLQAEPGLEIVAVAPDGVSALEMIRAHEPDIAVLDINMPELSGL